MAAVAMYRTVSLRFETVRFLMLGSVFGMFRVWLKKRVRGFRLPHLQCFAAS